MSVDEISVHLLRWYDAHARDLPWRVAPGSPELPDPYRVWLSEIMLQQTTVAAVRGYFAAFTARWPTVRDLAAADDGQVMTAWAGLGYYARARNLLACARAVVTEHGGRFPDSEAGLRALPGIGAYSAAAIAAIAFGRPAVVVDGNVERVVARLFAVEAPLPAARAVLRAHAARLSPARRPGDHAQAMMDLGATICTPRAPRCLLCPLAADCAGRASGAPERFPVKAAKAARPLRHGTIFWLSCGDAVRLVRRPSRGLLGGMVALPTGPWADAPPGLDEAPAPADWRWLPGEVRHGFTHFELALRVAAATVDRQDSGIWHPVAELGRAGLPTVFAKAARHAISAAQPGEQPTA